MDATSAPGAGGDVRLPAGGLGQERAMNFGSDLNQRVHFCVGLLVVIAGYVGVLAAVKFLIL